MKSLSANFKYIVSYVRILVLIGLALSCSDDETEPPAPEVTGVTPASALPNTLVAIAGKSFSTIFSENKVSFNGKEALVTVASATQLNVVVPIGASSGPVTVTVNGKAARNQPEFTVQLIPCVVTGISPASGGYGTVVTITGSNFLTETARNVVTFNGIPATVQSATEGSLTVAVPARSGSGAVSVNGTRAPLEFTYLPDIYIGGYERTVGFKIQGKYWKNGAPKLLDDLNQYSIIYDVTVSGSDVFTAGYQYNGTTSVAKYWKNDVATILGDGINYSQLRAILVAGSDVYAAGYELNAATVMIARYWKNDVSVPLTDGTYPTFCNNIAINGNDVHTVGQVNFSGGYSAAMYWKNGMAKQLTSANSYGDASDIVLSGNDVYITGFQASPTNQSVAVYWKNGTPFPLTDGAYYSRGIDIEVAGSDVYVAGFENNSKGAAVAKYWKNGVPVLLSDGSTNAFAMSIKVVGNDVYVVGNEVNAGGTNIVKLWKNGLKTPITDGGYDAIPYGMDVR